MNYEYRKLIEEKDILKNKLQLKLKNFIKKKKKR
jgi:hypothetical protein